MSERGHVQVRFFARFRELLDCDAVSVALPEEGFHLSQLMTALAEKGELWAQVMSEENLIRAVNQTVVNDDPPLTPGDEVAFFPPVTGGCSWQISM